MNTYKKIIIFLFTFYTAFIFSQSQGTSELNISLGVATFEDFRSAAGDVATSLVTSAITGEELTHKDGSSQMAFTVHYSYAIKDRWMLGASLAYQNIKGNLFLDDKKSGHSHSAVYSLGVESNYRYISKPKFQMYSGLGAGYAFGKTTFKLGDALEFKNTNNDNSKINYFTFHVTALGFRVGKKLAAFAELGVGYKGIINGGLSYQF